MVNTCPVPNGPMRPPPDMSQTYVPAFTLEPEKRTTTPKPTNEPQTPNFIKKITEDKDLSITACRRADLVCTTVVDVSMAAVTIVVLVMVVALILRHMG